MCCDIVNPNKYRYIRDKIVLYLILAYIIFYLYMLLNVGVESAAPLRSFVEVLVWMAILIKVYEDNKRT